MDVPDHRFNRDGNPCRDEDRRVWVFRNLILKYGKEGRMVRALPVESYEAVSSGACE
jgi:hypothetical protein